MDLDFLGNLEYCDAIILVCADIFGDSFIDEISKLTQLIKLYPPEVPCYLIGAKTRVPNYNFAYYRSSKRDVAINEFIDEIMRRSTAILVTDKITKDWLISEFGCDIKRVLSFTGEKIEESDILKTFEEFCKKNNIVIDISVKDLFDFFNHGLGRQQHSLFGDEFQKEIIINKPYIYKYNNKVRCSATININGSDKELYVETDEENEKYMISERADAFLIAVIPYAIRYNHNIRCMSPVTEELYYNITNTLLPSLCGNSDKLYSILVNCETDRSQLRGYGVCTAVSGGVDSFYSIYKHYENKLASFSLTSLYVGNYLYEGEGKRHIYNNARKIANELNLPIIVTDTNVSKIFERYIPHIYYHAFKTFFGVLALRKAYDKYMYASTYDLSHFSLVDNATKDTAYYELLLAEVLSISGFHVYLSGGEVTRFEKIKAISNFEVTYDNLDVCLHPALGSNCGKCGKCTRTMLNLDMCGALDKYKKSFDINYFKKNKKVVLTQMVRDNTNAFYVEAYKYYKEKESRLIEEIEAELHSEKE